MDAHGFARLSKRIAQAPSRRHVLGVLGASVGAAVLGRPVVGQAVEDEVFGFCEVPGRPCQKNTKCCSGKCRDGICGCTKRGKYAISRFVCCSGKRKKGKCK